MKLGIVIQHYDARNDVRELVELVAARQDVVLFASQEKLQGITACCEKRAFIQHSRLSDRVWLQFFNVFGRLPASRNNFLITELFKLSSVSPLRRFIATLRLRLRMRLPSLMSFDFLLDRLIGSDTTPVEDIDRFVVITEVSSAKFLARILAAGKPVDAYVYSWDHACKHLSFSQRVQRWLVWHQGIAEDLVELQGIPRARTLVVGATQLAYLDEYLGRPELRQRRFPERYLYYGCGVGQIEMAQQEASLIGFIAETLWTIDPELTLLVRPYPMLADTTFFRELRQRPNIQFDEQYRGGRTDRSLRRDSIFERLNLQEHAEAFIHCGTTMGLEGAYFQTPVLFLDLRDFDYGVSPDHPLHLSRFIHQYHNDRYMLLERFPNVIDSTASAAATLRAVLAAPSAYLDYNRTLASWMPLRSLDEVAAELVASEALSS